MLYKLRALYKEYPQQYWLMIAGLVLATAGGSMVGPYLLIYVSEKLSLPLSTVAALVSINAGTGLISSFVAGWLADKVGRKLVMNLSLTLTGLTYFFMLYAETYPQFVFLMVALGLSNPLYQVGSDAMLADLVPSEKRTEAFAINRIANNAAFALGPAVGGFLATRSYHLTFWSATMGFLAYSLLLFFRARETLDRQAVKSSTLQPNAEAAPRGGYARVLRDGPYMAFVGLLSLGLIAPSILWILLAVYTKLNFGLPENQFGWIPTTNALMCVFVQYSVSQATRKHKSLPVVAVGMLIYALGVGSVALMSGFWGFWLSMVILTFGELTLVPTSSKYVADRAPAHLRGRYMSAYWIGWGLARTAAPLIGGFLNDAIAPRAIWLGALTLGLVSAFGLFLLSRRADSPQPSPAPNLESDGLAQGREFGVEYDQIS
ncbi:MAG: MFS transporter [Chloroflexota bacterium]|nr:MAG: MFS transporter [Chloroflexota bacterium]